MKLQSVGDLSIAFQSNRHNFELKTTLQRLSYELASGQKADLSSAVSGDYGPVASIERAMQTFDSLKLANTEAGMFVSTMQTAFEKIQDIMPDTAATLLMTSNNTDELSLTNASNDANSKFRSVISALNTRVADRAVFSGQATQSSALADADTILADLQTAIAAETDAAGVITVVETWFASGGGYDTVAYLGSANPPSDFRIAKDEKASIDITADDASIRNTLKSFALAALVSEGALMGQGEEQRAILRAAGETMLSAEGALTQTRAGVGMVEAQIEDAKTRTNAEVTALEIARSELLSVDPYRTATELEAAQTQLETLYTITARLSRLNLADYL